MGHASVAKDLNRTKPNIRLIDGSMLSELIFEHYEHFEPHWQTLIPLKRRYITGRVKAES